MDSSFDEYIHSTVRPFLAVQFQVMPPFCRQCMVQERKAPLSTDRPDQAERRTFRQVCHSVHTERLARAYGTARSSYYLTKLPVYRYCSKNTAIAWLRDWKSLTLGILVSFVRASIRHRTDNDVIR